jgi:sulfoxide reductase heme-binding subunit YedZ
VIPALNGALRRLPTLVVYLAGLSPLLWLVWQGVNNDLGVDPVKTVEHALGLHGLQFIVAGLVVTPLRRFVGVNLIRFRRALGLLAFFYVTLHLATWVLLDLQLRWNEIWADILKRPYITIGMAGFALMLPLALTSNNASVRRLGAARWQKLHRLTYLIAIAGVLHFIWLVKAWPPEPLLYGAAVFSLLIIRLLPKAARRFAPGQARV